MEYLVSAMLRKGIPPEEIAKMTDLPLQKVRDVEAADRSGGRMKMKW